MMSLETGNQKKKILNRGNTKMPANNGKQHQTPKNLDPVFYHSLNILTSQNLFINIQQQNHHTNRIIVHRFRSRQDPATVRYSDISLLLGKMLLLNSAPLAPITKLSQLHSWLKTKEKSRSHPPQSTTAALSEVTFWRTVAIKGS
jgi:hypothetical protein